MLMLAGWLPNAEQQSQFRTAARVARRVNRQELQAHDILFQIRMLMRAANEDLSTSDINQSLPLERRHAI